MTSGMLALKSHQWIYFGHICQYELIVDTRFAHQFQIHIEAIHGVHKVRQKTPLTFSIFTKSVCILYRLALMVTCRLLVPFPVKFAAFDSET